jgi:hypothetical protein
MMEDKSETRIRDALHALADAQILDVSNSRGRPLLKDDKRRRYRKIYRLFDNLNSFEKISNIFLNSGFEEFLKSEYTNKIIEKNTFANVYTLLKPHIEPFKLKRAASESLLNHSATKKEYANFFDQLKQEILESNILDKKKENKGNFTALQDVKEKENLTLRHIQILRDLDPLMAIPFYRYNVGNGFRDLYTNLARNSLISEGIKQFLIYDAFLSPFTPYPIYGLELLLFSRPFERLYENAYLTDNYSRSILIKRAFTIYSWFHEFLFEFLKNSPIFNKHDLEILSRELVFHWNVASTRFDLVLYCLDKIKLSLCSGKYHLQSKDGFFQVIDLVTNKPLMTPRVSENIFYYGMTPRDIKIREDGTWQMKCMEDPFDYLRSCHAFREAGKESKTISIEKIMSILRPKFKTYREGS